MAPSFPPPALGESRHRVLAGRSIAVDGRAIFMVPESERPKPRRPNRRGGGLQDAADNSAVCKHVEIVVIPLAGGAGSGGAFEDQVVLVPVPRSFGWHFRYVKLGIIEQRQLERPANGPHILLRKDQLGDPLPLAAQLSFFADA